MISLAPGTKVFLACTPVDLRNGFDGLAAKVQQVIGADPFSGQLFLFRGKRGDYLKGLYWDGSGLCIPCSQNLCKGDGVRRYGGGECRGARDLGAVDGKAPRWRAIRTRPCPAGRNCPRHTAGGLRL